MAQELEEAGICMSLEHRVLAATYRAGYQERKHMSTQREIKFRAWDTNSGKMADIDMQAYLEPHGLNETIEQHTKDGLVLMQYTGLKDKNGKEIYEGDILTHRYVPVYVVKDMVDFLISVGDGDHWEGMLTNEWEVIGNIYENTELLEKK